jgi:Protein of unknown function (DUF4238)
MLDHYIPRIHLSKWSWNEHGQLHAIRKSDLSCFTPKPKGVCAIQDGSSNPYLDDERKIEKFLKEIEPKYSVSVEKLINNEIDNECISTIAGLIACISSCSPTAKRLHTPILRKVIATTTKILDKNGQLPKLHGVGFREHLKNEMITLKIDGKYPQSFGIEGIQKLTTTLVNCQWQIIRNSSQDSPFFTSDYPIALEPSKEYPWINNKIVPLAPDLAVRIKPDPDLKTNPPDKPFARFKYTISSAKRTDLEYLNRIIVRCAEDLVFYRYDYSWVIPFVEKNRHYRIESVIQTNSAAKGEQHISRQQIVTVSAGSSKEILPDGNHWFEIVPATELLPPNEPKGDLSPDLTD